MNIQSIKCNQKTKNQKLIHFLTSPHHRPPPKCGTDSFSATHLLFLTFSILFAKLKIKTSSLCMLRKAAKVISEHLVWLILADHRARPTLQSGFP